MLFTTLDNLSDTWLIQNRAQRMVIAVLIQSSFHQSNRWWLSQEQRRWHGWNPSSECRTTVGEDQGEGSGSQAAGKALVQSRVSQPSQLQDVRTSHSQNSPASKPTLSRLRKAGLEQSSKPCLCRTAFLPQVLL